jgi:hypothetical protein
MIRPPHLRKVWTLKDAATGLLEAALHIFDERHVTAPMVDPIEQGSKTAGALFEQKRMYCQCTSQQARV